MKLFGTDGIRGVAGKFPLDKTTMNALGHSIYDVLSPESVLIGKDTRVSSVGIEEEISKALLSHGVKVYSAGIIPTPSLAMLTKKGGFSCGIMISASHNPPEYNGVKIFSESGEKLSEELEEKIEKKIKHYVENKNSLKKDKKLSIKDYDPSTYFDFLLFASGIEKGDKEKKIVVDCGFGATFREALFIFERLGYSVIPLNCKPVGEKINVKCGALYPEVVSQAVKREKAFLGFSYDGDGDRVIAVDEKGRVFNGDHMLYLLAKSYSENGYKGGIVGTVMSNLSLEKKIRDMSLEFYRTPVGDKYVWEKMKETESIVGGETSGHIILKEFHTTGDGVLTSLKILEYLEKKNKKLSEIRDELKLFPQKLYSIRYKKKIPVEEFEEIENLKNSIREKFNGNARCVIRYSGTEPVLRIMVEGENKSEIEKLIKKYLPLIEKKIGG